ncbi:4-coumarate CoA ligase [Quillaja saponaria]|uniref:4-coumarate CoA ligase n=1 Tax=Quillaja saponaria TaxID=32244 RepID=A0AAD7P824_QUISA|nr:4-coumarate CoA ligase [Quillaja saponaria]
MTTNPRANSNHSDSSSIDPRSGFCCNTNIYHSLRSSVSLPSETTPLSIADYVFNLLQSSPPPPTSAALIDSTTGRRITYPEFSHFVKTLAASLQNRLGLSKGDSAFILSPNSYHIPILYLSLFSIGVIVSPSNPASTRPEVSHQIELCKPDIAFTTSESTHKVPSLRFGTVLLDSPEFDSMMTSPTGEFCKITVKQSDTEVIMYSSGTTGPVKGVKLSHRNWISVVAGNHAIREVRSSPAVLLCIVPQFHVYGFGFSLRALAFGQTLVTMKMRRFDLKEMLQAIEALRVTHVALAPPVVMMMAKDVRVMDGYDLSSLEVIRSGGAPLRRSVLDLLSKRFPNLQLAQAYGLTEVTGRVFSAVGREESKLVGATGKLVSNFQAKIVEPETDISLPPLKLGELWLRGPCIMEGYVGDEEATAAIVDKEGWLRTGDLCYFDKEGFLFYVDRIKELIKYKGYQVAPAELEHLLQSHPDILEAAVVPYPDEEAGQVPVTFVVRRFGSHVDELQIKDFVAKQVAPYKRIRRVMFVETLPKNSPGKVLRKELIKLALLNVNSKL